MPDLIRRPDHYVLTWVAIQIALILKHPAELFDGFREMSVELEDVRARNNLDVL